MPKLQDDVVKGVQSTLGAQNKGGSSSLSGEGFLEEVTFKPKPER